MSDQNDEKRLDDLLDSALSAYSAVEPRLGLEARILARVRDSAEQRQWWNVRWLVAGAVATAVAALVLSVLFLRPAQKPRQVQVHEEQPVVVQPHLESNKVAREAPRVHEERRHHVQPRQELARSDRPAVFPTPSGLTEQEKLMLAYMAQTPKEELIAQLQTLKPEDEEFWKDQQPARPQR